MKNILEGSGWRGWGEIGDGDEIVQNDKKNQGEQKK